MTELDLYAILPLIVVWLAGRLSCWWSTCGFPKQRKGITALLAAVGLAVALGFALAQAGTDDHGLQRHGRGGWLRGFSERASSWSAAWPGSPWPTIISSG